MSRAAVLVLLMALLWGCKAAKLARVGESEQLRPEGSGAGGSPVVVIAIDGVDRDLLYELVRGGHLPGLAALLGEQGHAHFDDGVLSVLPSSTIPAWASLWTGARPAEHGVTGNELWIREREEYAAPAPVMLDSTDSVVGLYAEGYANELLEVPTVWERLRQEDSRTRIWVSLAQFHRGADRLLLADSDIVTDMAASAIESVAGGRKRDVWAQIDEEAIDAVLQRLDGGDVPDVLALYLPGTDLYAHVASRGPLRARQEYLTEVLDPRFARLAERLRGRDAWVIVVSDHGHTEVLADDAHALDEEPMAVLRHAGFRVRPFEREAKGRWNAVVAYQGFMAYVYLADRSSGDWRRPPRFEEDVLAAAGAITRSGMGKHLEMILARRPRPYPERDLPFEVYEGGRLVPVDEWLRRHPHADWVAVASRLEELGVGRHGERAGDLVLVSRVGEALQERWYFGPRYYSQHGSPTRRDSEVPLIVAHPRYDAADIAAIVRAVLGDRHRQADVAELILRLRR
jgi:hypothetical protein